MSADQGSGPAVLRVLLGAELRKLRELKGISREDAGERIRGSASKISRMELGRVGFKMRDVEDLLTLYGEAAGETRERLLMLARRARNRGWWQGFADVLPDWFENYIGLESSAALIRTYEIQFVPGLLQTEEYARAVIRLNLVTENPEEVERRVTLRKTRQQLLTRPDGPKLWAVMDEAAIRRPIGGRETMRAQLSALIEATERSNITLQIIPFQLGGHSAVGGAFTLLRFPEEGMHDIVYIERLGGAIYLEKRHEVAPYVTVMDRLSAESPPPARTRRLLERARAEA